MAILFWQGPSQLDGHPIIVALTGHDTKSANTKTGPVLQTWILNGATAPSNAVRTGEDGSICGQCPQRHYLGGGCYVIPWQAPTTIWKSVQGQSQWIDTRGDDPIPNTATALRLGSYGDPMAVPGYVWKHLQDAVGGLPIIGYTHQWPRELSYSFKPADLAWYRQHLQASTENDLGDKLAHDLGWSTFRIIPTDGPPPPNIKECPASTGTTCDQCMACGAGSNIYIRAHGARKGKIKGDTTK